MNLLVTGGAGFIGSHFIEHALGHHEVAKLINLDCLTYAGDLQRLESIKDDSRYAFEKVDLRQEARVMEVVKEHSITHVVHLAAETHVDRSIENARRFVESNVAGTLNLLEACRAEWSAAQRRMFVQVSTDEVYGSLDAGHLPFTEDSPMRPNSPYAASKASADCLVRSYVQTYGFPSVITRCSNNYGPRQHPEKLIPMVIDHARHRRPIPLYGDGMNVRDWLHVEDHCTALWSGLTRGAAGEVYNIGGRAERTNLEIVRMVCDLVDEMSPERLSEARSLITLVDDRPGHDRRYANDASKIERELGWRALRSLEEGLRETVRSVVHSSLT